MTETFFFISLSLIMKATSFSTFVVLLGALILFQSLQGQEFYCYNAGRSGGVNCTSEKLCCSEGTMAPTCLPGDGSKICCRWYLAATQCDPDETCGGSLGTGASSSAFCCKNQFCGASGIGVNTCCNEGETCCGIRSVASWCCASNQKCGTTYNNCTSSSL